MAFKGNLNNPQPPKELKHPFEDEEALTGMYKSGWFVDKNIPIFKGEGRKYIDDLIFVGE